MQVPRGSAVLQRMQNKEATIFEGWMNQNQNQTSSPDWLIIAMTVSWTIWNERCEVNFQNKKAEPLAVSKRAISFATYTSKLNSQDQLHNINTQRNSPPKPVWKPPPNPYLVINCDASYDSNTGLTGVSLVLRDSANTWRGCSAKFYAGVSNPEHAECLAFFEAVSWSKEMRHTHVVFETDLQAIETYINSAKPVIAWENESILIDVLDCLKFIPFWLCRYIPRDCNKPDDELVEFSRKFRVTSLA
ncbi:uncharacterized protein LOC113340144 [Papaver somniferum]|uniref:uncharacterized protein LOC113340144 n=1 Tax=Papaver somniferum TaxID=3469 RepID=UPI000E6FA1D5|nr:uncharacterized protein LOC113340144 [Papaver somniferum]